MCTSVNKSGTEALHWSLGQRTLIFSYSFALTVFFLFGMGGGGEQEHHGRLMTMCRATLRRRSKSEGLTFARKCW